MIVKKAAFQRVRQVTLADVENRTITVTRPYRLDVTPNKRMNHWAKAALTAEHVGVGYFLGSIATAFVHRLDILAGVPAVRSREDRRIRRVELVRIGPGKPDDDNVVGAFKGIRDGIAKSFGVDDGDPRWRWEYDKSRDGGEAGRYAVRMIFTMYVSKVRKSGEA